MRHGLKFLTPPVPLLASKLLPCVPPCRQGCCLLQRLKSRAPPVPPYRQAAARCSALSRWPPLSLLAGKLLPVAVRVGQAVDVVAQAGRPKTITGFQTHNTPVRVTLDLTEERGYARVAG